MPELTTVAPWARRCGYGAIAAALPTVVWRVVVGFGLHLGTPASWRRSEAIPGSGTVYVCFLSALQLMAALLTLVLVAPGGDRVPFGRGRRFPRGLVLGVSVLGTVVLMALCVLSAVSWRRVDPFRDAAAVTAWTILCWTCYAIAFAWPALLAVAIVGYHRARRAEP